MRLTPVAGLQPPQYGEGDHLDGHHAEQDLAETATRLFRQTGSVGRVGRGTYSRVLCRGQPVDITAAAGTFPLAPGAPRVPLVPSAPRPSMTRFRFAAILPFIALGCTATEVPGPAVPGSHARAQITTSETFDSKNVPPYTGVHDAAYAFIDANIRAHTENLRR